MNFSPELILFGILPVIIGITILLLSFRVCKTHKSVFQITASILNSILFGYAITILYQIFFLDYYPSYLPHLIIFLSGLILVFQYASPKKITSDRC